MDSVVVIFKGRSGFGTAGVERKERGVLFGRSASRVRVWTKGIRGTKELGLTEIRRPPNEGEISAQGQEMAS
jgi:hypothetical protein